MGDKFAVIFFGSHTKVLKMARHSATDGEDGAFSADSPLSNDCDNSIGSSTGGLALKKGPWTSAEDAILVEYVKKHGEGNWNAVQKHSGLLRCGKSCRLRWANHLRPNLKKGAFTPEEERLIIELHAKMGNKWARMAAHLPGRTDNEIKNYWNTRIKRRQRAGLPLYPPEFCPPANSNYQSEHHSPGIYFGNSGCQEIMQSNCYEINGSVFDGFNKLPDTSEFTNISADMVTRDFGHHPFSSFVSKTVGFQKHTQESDELMSDYGGDGSGVPSFDRTQTENYKNGMSPFGLCYPHDPNLTEKLLRYAVNQDCDVMSSLTFSASKHFAGVQKLELPSFQYQETGLGIWDPAPESSDFLVHADHSRPLPPLKSPPCSDGLLEDLVYESKALRKAENRSATQLNSFKITPGEITEYADPSSPSGNSMGSSFSGCLLTGTSGCSLEQQMPMHHVKSEVFDESWIMGGESKATPPAHMDYSRPDAILGSCWVDQTAFVSGQRSSVADSIAALLGEDYSGSNSASASALGSCTWDHMSAVHGTSHLS